MNIFTDEEMRVFSIEKDYIKRCLNNKIDEECRLNLYSKVSKEYNSLKHEYERTRYAYETKARSSTTISKLEQKNSKVELTIKSKTNIIDEKIRTGKLRIQENEDRRNNEINSIRDKYLRKIENEINAVNTRCDNYAHYLNNLMNGYYEQKGIVITDLSGNLIETKNLFDESDYPVLSKMKYDMNVIKIDYDRHNIINSIMRKAYIEREKYEEQKNRINYTNPVCRPQQYEPPEPSLPKELIKENFLPAPAPPAPLPPPADDDNMSVHTNSSISDDTENDSDYEPTEEDIERKRKRMMRRLAIEEKKATRQALKEAQEKKDAIKKDEEERRKRREVKKVDEPAPAPAPVVETNDVVETKPKALTVKEFQERMKKSKSKTQK